MLPTPEPIPVFQPESYLPLHLDDWTETSQSLPTKVIQTYGRNRPHVSDEIDVEKSIGWKIRREHDQTYRLNWDEFAASKGIAGKYPIEEGETSSSAVTVADSGANESYRWLNDTAASEMKFNPNGQITGVVIDKGMGLFTTAQTPALNNIPNSEMRAHASVRVPSNKKGWQIEFDFQVLPDSFYITQSGQMHLSTQPKHQYHVALDGNKFIVDDYNKQQKVLECKRSKDGTTLDLSRLDKEQLEIVQSLIDSGRTLLGIDLSDRPGHIGSQLVVSAKAAIQQP